MMVGDVTPLGLVTRTPFAPGPLVVVGVALVWYIRSVRRFNTDSTTRWPIGRTAAFTTGMAVVAVATLSGLASWDQTDFEVHGIIDMLVGMVAPIGLALGAPLSLAGQAGGPRLRRLVTRGLERPWARILFRPLTGWIVYSVSLFALYFSSFFRVARAHESLLQLGHAEFLIAGCLLIWPLLGADPIPQRADPGWRITSLMLMLPFYTVFGMGLESMTRSIAPGVTAAAMHGAGGVIWSAGSVIAITGTLGVAYIWLLSDERRARERDDVDDTVLEAQAAVWRVSRLLAERESALARDRRLAARAATPANARPADPHHSPDPAGSAGPGGPPGRIDQLAPPV